MPANRPPDTAVQILQDIVAIAYSGDSQDHYSESFGPVFQRAKEFLAQPERIINQLTDEDYMPFGQHAQTGSDPRKMKDVPASYFHLLP